MILQDEQLQEIARSTAARPPRRMPPRVAPVFMLVAALVPAPERSPEPDLKAVLMRVGERVEDYYQRAQSLVAIEDVQLQPGGEGMNSGFGRRLTYELHVAWEPAASPGRAADANVVRKLLRVGGRAAKPTDEPGCMDPKPVSPEPLSMLLPDHRHEYAFTLTGRARLDSRATLRIDYKSLAHGPVEVTWRDDCVTVSLPGRSRGRVWVDERSYDVVRLDEQLIGFFDIPVPPERSRFSSPNMVIERADSSIRYKPVVFHDPDETLLLPASIESLTVVRGSGVPTLRKVQRFSGYRRFLADSHLVAEPRPR